MKPLNDKSKNEFSVPDGYFEKLTASVTEKIDAGFKFREQQILKSTVQRSSKIYRLYWAAAATAAAVVIGIILLNSDPYTPTNSTQSFEAALDSTDLQVDDVLLILDHEDLAYLFKEEIEEIPAFQVEVQELNDKKKMDTSSIDSLSTDEILDYLLEEDSDLLIY